MCNTRLGESPLGSYGLDQAWTVESPCLERPICRWTWCSPFPVCAIRGTRLVVEQDFRILFIAASPCSVLHVLQFTYSFFGGGGIAIARKHYDVLHHRLHLYIGIPCRELHCSR